jgi:hypothetical protein
MTLDLLLFINSNQKPPAQFSQLPLFFQPKKINVVNNQTSNNAVKAKAKYVLAGIMCLVP